MDDEVRAAIRRQAEALRREAERTERERQLREEQREQEAKDRREQYGLIAESILSSESVRREEQLRMAALAEEQKLLAQEDRSALMQVIGESVHKIDQQRLEEQQRTQQRVQQEGAQRKKEYEEKCMYQGERFGSPTERDFYRAWHETYPDIPLEHDYPIGYHIEGTKYYADFVHPASKIIVEIDGSRHYTADAQGRDHNRSDDLQNLGWRVVRRTGRQVATDTVACVHYVKNIIDLQLGKEQ